MTKKVAIILLPGFALTSFSLTVEAFSVANALEKKELYKCVIFSASDEVRDNRVLSSNGIMIQADEHISEFRKSDLICLCAYKGASKYNNSHLMTLLKNHYKNGGKLVSLSSGSFIFARSGLMKEMTCTVTSEQENVFRELYPRIPIQESLYSVSDQIYTCKGGTTALDLMMYLIGLDFGTNLTERISQRFQADKIRTLDEIKKSNHHLKLRLKSPALGAAIEIMETNIEEPYSIDEICRMIGTSIRQLELTFRKHFDTTPNKHYLKIRLERAYELVEATHLPLSEIANACGFSSHSYMGQCFRKEFGCHPSAVRKSIDSQ